MSKALPRSMESRMSLLCAQHCGCLEFRLCARLKDMLRSWQHSRYEWRSSTFLIYSIFKIIFQNFMFSSNKIGARAPREFWVHSNGVCWDPMARIQTFFNSFYQFSFAVWACIRNMHIWLNVNELKGKTL